MSHRYNNWNHALITKVNSSGSIGHLDVNELHSKECDTGVCSVLEFLVVESLPQALILVVAPMAQAALHLGR